jgi:ribosome recycling factor
LNDRDNIPVLLIFLYNIDSLRKNADMTEELELIIEDAEASMKKAIGFLEAELVKIRAGKANPNMLDGIMVEYYGSPTPINQVANINIMDARTISIQPWEKKTLPLIERAIIAANIGMNPQNDGINIRLYLPPLTEERRRELVKKSAAEAEQSKVAIRNLRREAIEEVKRLQKEGLSEDLSKDSEKEVQDITDRYIALVDRILSSKEKEVMSI